MYCVVLNIYVGELVEMIESVVKDFKIVVGMVYYVVIYIVNGYGVWEVVLCNIFFDGDVVFVFFVGCFGEGWVSMVESIGVKVEFMLFLDL